MERIDIGRGIELATVRGGEGPVRLVFIHGYSMSHESWERVLPHFPTDRYSTIAYDLRGFGWSSKPSTGHSMHQHALDLRMLLDRLEIERAVLIGHSLGGAIAQEFATLHPARLAGFVSCSALARFRPLPGLDEAKRRRAEGFGTEQENREILELAVERYFDPRNADRETLDRFVRIALQASSAALREQLIDAYTAPPLDRHAFETMRLPTLAMCGATDHVAPVENAIALCDVVPDSELVVLPRVGHTPMWEAPAAWAAAVRAFLDRRVTTAD